MARIDHESARALTDLKARTERDLADFEVAREATLQFLVFPGSEALGHAIAGIRDAQRQAGFVIAESDDPKYPSILRQRLGWIESAVASAADYLADHEAWFKHADPALWSVYAARQAAGAPPIMPLPPRPF